LQTGGSDRFLTRYREPMRVLALIHGPTVRPELFADVVEDEGHELLEWDIRVQGLPPDGFDAVMVLGGDQNVGEEVEHPWLHDEYDALRRLVDDDVPLLGICLGAQTLAHATGGTVEPIGSTLSGFYETSLTAAGEADTVLGLLPPRFPALNLNGHRFTPPDEATVLAVGPVTQAFRLGARAWAVQFHPEVRRGQVIEWFTDDGAITRPLEEFLEELDEHLPLWQERGRALCSAFLAAAVS
jgi:GMP synthase (glutamine-hydrolysing)